jgi:hypothetical protein
MYMPNIYINITRRKINASPASAPIPMAMRMRMRMHVKLRT